MRLQLALLAGIVYYNLADGAATMLPRLNLLFSQLCFFMCVVGCRSGWRAARGAPASGWGQGARAGLDVSLAASLVSAVERIPAFSALAG